MSYNIELQTYDCQPDKRIDAFPSIFLEMLKRSKVNKLPGSIMRDTYKIILDKDLEVPTNSCIFCLFSFYILRHK